jgi:hypothetical protein
MLPIRVMNYYRDRRGNDVSQLTQEIVRMVRAPRN